jgi:hypothetical protein
MWGLKTESDPINRKEPVPCFKSGNVPLRAITKVLNDIFTFGLEQMERTTGVIGVETLVHQVEYMESSAAEKGRCERFVEQGNEVWKSVAF